MRLAGIVLQNVLFYRKKTLPVALLCGLFIFLPASSWLLVHRIISLADRPLLTLDTELILQQSSEDREAGTIKTRGLIEPFNLRSFGKEEAAGGLAAIKGIDRYSTALVLWKLDPQNTLTVIGLDTTEPPVGLRKIEGLLVKGGRFFTDNEANEIILERHFAKLFGYKLGRDFQLAGRELAIVGLVDFTEQSNLSNAEAFLPYDTALALAGLRKRVANQMFIALTGAADLRGISNELARAFPGFSVISRDSLYKNLSAFNRLIYRGGYLFVLLILPISLLLLLWVLKMHRMEFTGHTEILRILGWPVWDLRYWRFLDLGYLLVGGLVLALTLSLFLHFTILPHLRITPLLDQGFHI